MPGSIPQIGLDPAGPQPEIEVIFGQAQLGSYRCFLWDQNAANPQEIRHGNNIDSIADKFPIAQLAAASLPHCFLSWELLMQAPDPSPGQLYHVTVIVRQAGNVVSGGVLQDSGPFQSNTKSVVLFARFI